MMIIDRKDFRNMVLPDFVRP